jgi:uncharacterized protein with ATP-grasp and redox domains
VWLSIAGNIIDAGLGHAGELRATVERVLSTGSDSPGTILDRCSQRFLRTCQEAALVIAKGGSDEE